MQDIMLSASSGEKSVGRTLASIGRTRGPDRSDSRNNRTYGSLAGAVVFLLWLWITNLALLFSAALDAELERGRELQAGIAAEDSIQLTARDTRKIEKAEEKAADDRRRGRAIREGRGRQRGSR
jgi:membrane protein